jgi:hypothetical protein
MNTSKKGYLKEKRCADDLTKEGWMIVFKSVRTRWATYDYADLFDIVAYRNLKDILNPNRKFISCKSYNDCRSHPQHQKEIKEFKDKHGLVGESYELWLWFKPRWRGAGKNKHFEEARWEKIIL